MQRQRLKTMNTIIAKAGVDDEHMYEQAAEILRSGGLVAFPTETVYGLGGDALNPDASHKIYSATGASQELLFCPSSWHRSQSFS